MNTQEKCPKCNHPNPDKGRAFDGRRAYKCLQCGNEWTNGLQGRQQRFSPQRLTNQFSNSRGKNAN